MAVKYLVSDKTGDHLPYTDEAGNPDHRLMGAAWAALHGGYRGNKYEGPDKEAAIAKLTRLYKSVKMELPSETAEAYSGYGSLQASAETPEEGKTHQALSERGFKATAVNNDGSSMWQKGASTVHVRRDGSWIHGSAMGDTADALCTNLGAMAESAARSMVASVNQFAEGAYNPTDGTLAITVIKPGFNRSKERYYPPDVLKRDYKIFEGAKMFADHQTDAESRTRPENSVNNWVGSIKKVWAEGDGTIKATAAVIDPTFKTKLEELNKQGMLPQMGVSIRAVGEAKPTKINETPTHMVESLLRARSVDFVTFAGAGGQVEAIEADRGDEFDVELVSEAQLRRTRPDLVQLIESHVQENPKVKTLEQQLQEAQTQLADANKKLEEAEKVSKKAAAAVELGKLLAESKLPEKAQERLKKQFAEAVSIDGMKEAIDFEKEYIKSFGVVAGKGGSVKNLGEKDTTTQVSEADRFKRRVEIHKAQGMTEAQAEVAARGR